MNQLDIALEAAREQRKIHPQGTIIIDLPRLQVRTTPIRLGPDDSGNDNAPLILRGPPNEGATITGGVTLSSEEVSDLNVDPVSRVPPEFQKKLRRVRLVGAAKFRIKPEFTEHGSSMGGPGRLFVFEGNRRMEPARWPSHGYMHLSGNVEHDDRGNVLLRLPGDFSGLENESNLWVLGFWAWNWWFETRKVLKESPGIINFRPPDAPLMPGARYYLFNIAQGLDRTGVYYFYAPTDSLYFVPQEGDTSGELTVAIADTLLQIRGASNIRFENVAVEKTIGPAVTLENARNIVFSSCFVAHTGREGIVINGGSSDSIEDCVLDDIGSTAIDILGGDKKTLTPSGHVVSNTKLSRFGREMPTYQPAIRLNGVGHRVEGCEISGSSHAGITFGGNDHRIVGNILHDLVLDSTDAGAIYAGRNWTSRGTVIGSNFIYGVTNRIDNSPIRGVYLDDEYSGTTIRGNVFSNVDEPILIGGGRDNLVSENLFLSYKTGPIRIDSRGLSWQSSMVEPGGVLREGLSQVPYREAPYSDRYPGLATILTDHPGAPLNNRFIDNLSRSDPIVKYDLPKTASFGVDSGNRNIGEVAIDFPSSLNGVPNDAPAFRALKQTQALIQNTAQKMKSLPFLDRIGDR